MAIDERSNWKSIIQVFSVIIVLLSVSSIFGGLWHLYEAIVFWSEGPVKYESIKSDDDYIVVGFPGVMMALIELTAAAMSGYQGIVGFKAST